MKQLREPRGVEGIVWIELRDQLLELGLRDGRRRRNDRGRTELHADVGSCPGEVDHVEEDSPRIQRGRIAVEIVAVALVGEARDVCRGAELWGGDAQVREFVQTEARWFQVDAEDGTTGQVLARNGDDRSHGDRGLEEQGACRER